MRDLLAWFWAPQPAKRFNMLYAGLLGVFTGQGIYVYTRQMRRLLYTTVLLLLAILYAVYVVYVDIIAHFDATALDQAESLNGLVRDALKGTAVVSTIAVVNNLVCTLDGLREISLAKKALANLQPEAKGPEVVA